METVRVEDLEFHPGEHLCVHLHWYEAGAALFRRLKDVCLARGKTVAFGGPPFSRQLPEVRSWHLQPQLSAAEWLAAAGDISLPAAERLIAECPFRIQPQIGGNAGNPLAILSIAAALLQQPQALCYSLVGLDPRGRQNIREYLAARFPGCLVHLNYQALSCQDTYPARCVDLTPF